MDELKPCPFCGKQPKVLKRPDKFDGYFCAIACYCGKNAARAYQFATDKASVDAAFEKAAQSWNRRAAPENKTLALPTVSEKDRQSMHDFLHDCYAEWIDDPAVGLIGMNEGEATLANAIMDALDARKPEGSEKL